VKTIDIEKAELQSCIGKAQSERIIVTRKGRPVAVIVGVEGLDKEQIELGTSDKFWKLIRERRRQRTIDRATLESKLARPKTPRRRT
jgi:prevent-host-death family protein